MEIKLTAMIVLGCIASNLLCRVSGNIANIFMGIGKKLGNRGETSTDTGTETGEIKFTPEQQKVVDKLIDRRYSEIKSKYSDYDQLKEFKSKYEADQQNKSQEDLVKAKKYEEAEKTYKTQLGDLSGKLSAKDQQIQDLKIGYELTNEISRQGAYTEEALAIIKPNVVVDQDGRVRVKVRDSNGVETQVAIEEGVKKILESRPHLIKANFKSGSGSSSSTQTNAAEANTSDLNALNAEYAQAMSRGDMKKTSELKLKIRALLGSKGVTLNR